jgi:hypothetical protein
LDLDLDFEAQLGIGLGLGLGLRGPTRIGLGLVLGLRSPTRNWTWTSGPENRTLVKSAAAKSDFGFGLGLRALPCFAHRTAHRRMCSFTAFTTRYRGGTPRRRGAMRKTSSTAHAAQAKGRGRTATSMRTTTLASTEWAARPTRAGRAAPGGGVEVGAPGCACALAVNKHLPARPHRVLLRAPSSTTCTAKAMCSASAASTASAAHADLSASTADRRGAPLLLCP